MNRDQFDIMKWLAPPLYGVALLMLLTPVMDFVTNVWPLRLGDVQWRYGSVGLLAGFMLTPLFGILFILVSATALKHRTIVFLVSIFNVVAAALSVILIVFYALDVVQLRGSVPEEAHTTFDIGAAKAALKLLLVAGSMAWLGLAGLRVSKGKELKQRELSDVPLVRSSGSSASDQASEAQ